MPAATTDAPPPPPAAWQFSPVETMHVPEESAFVAPAPAEPRLDDAAASVPPMRAAAEPVKTEQPLRFGDADRDKLVVGEHVDSTTLEQYRHLAAVLHHAQKASGVRSVMVTSALPSEGKTLTATNLALTLSQSYQRRVLLIDADLRRPRLRDMFALKRSEGLTDSLMQSRAERPDRLPVHQVSPTLWVLAAGAIVPDPMSLLVSPAMKQLLDDARDAFDWVVVDTPPVAILPDANLLAAMIDTALLVVSAESTPYPMVQRAADAIGAKRILGVVLNRAAAATVPNGYGYYGYNLSQTGRPAPAPKRRWLGWLRKPGGGQGAAANASAARHVQ